MTDVPIKTGETQRWGGRDSHVTMEAETGVTLPQPRNACGYHKLEEAGKGPPQRLWREHGRHLETGLLVSRTKRTSCCFYPFSL